MRLKTSSSCAKEPTLDDRVKIRKQSALEDAEEPEPKSKERTMTVLKFTAGLGLTEAGIKLF
jgi:type II secretory ATPase GspE/PulE/Tfp pilus assembly ATPase PilB-like protein